MSFFTPKKQPHGDDDFDRDRRPDPLPPIQPAVEKEKEDDYSPKEPAGKKEPAGFADEGLNVGGIGSLELKVVRPKEYTDVSMVADYLLNRRTVVMNMEAVNREVQRRMIDFLSGVAYAINGQIKQVAPQTFIVTPNNVDVSDGTLGEEPEEDVPASGADHNDNFGNDDYIPDVREG